jgi:hypothetical protein
MKDFLIEVLISIFCGIVAVPLACLGIHISVWNKDSLQARVKARVGWWLIDSSEEVLNEMRFICKCFDIEPQYLLSSAAEIKIASEIIKEFQEHSKYLYDQLEGTKKNATTPYHYFYMYYLKSFLDDNNGRYSDFDKKYIEKSRERRDNAGSYYSIKYSLTEYGIAYNKLRYMARFYLEKSNKQNVNYYSDGIKKILDTQEITFFEDIK